MFTSNFKKHFKKVHEKVLCIFCTPGYTIHRNTYDKENPVLVRHYSKLLVEHMETDHNASNNISFVLFASILKSSEIKLIKHGYENKQHKVSSSEFISAICNFMSSDGEKISCIKCGYRCARKNVMMNHILSAHENFRLSCDQCDFKAYNQVNMKYHMRKQHNADGGPVHHKCEFCDYTSENTQLLKKHTQDRHVNVHAGELYSCPLCSYATKTKQYMKRDRKVVHD